VISNVVQEELEQAPDHLRQAILSAIADIEFELVLESEESRNLFSSYEKHSRSCRRDIETTCGTSESRARATWMLWCRGTSVIWST
jgi:hypothetical protein